jgi:hypothetical protein
MLVQNSPERVPPTGGPFLMQRGGPMLVKKTLPGGPFCLHADTGSPL